MGTSMAVLSATDDDIRRHATEGGAEDWLNGVIGRGGSEVCSLSDTWPLLHALITVPGLRWKLPMGALRRGQVSLRRVSDPTHAIFAPVARRFARGLDRLSEAAMRRRAWVLRAQGTSGPGELGRWRATGGSVDEAVESVSWVLGPLRDFTQRAADTGHGLVFCRYEDR